MTRAGTASSSGCSGVAAGTAECSGAGARAGTVGPGTVECSGAGVGMIASTG